jgi:arsenite/tail-anchored protein-transporting ATPase
VTYCFFAGKGGVGKTTCASAYALAALRRNKSARILLVSTDPAHSLGDALDVRLTSTPRPVRPRLDAVELDATRAFARWLARHRGSLAAILENGTWLDASDVDALLDLAMPGIDELMGLLEIVRVASPASRPYDVVVVDTAPTGHTLRLLSAPETVGAVAAVLDSLQAEHRLIRDQLARVRRGPEASDRLIDMLAAQARDTAALVRDPRRAAFRWVTLPEALSVAESEDAVCALEDAGIRVAEIVVNRITPPTRGCSICGPRRAEEQRVIARLRTGIGRGRRVRFINATLREPVGVVALMKLNAAADVSRRSVPAAKAEAPEISGKVDLPDTNAPALPLLERALVFFGGKGGVGKTTIAAAAALQLARAHPDRRILLLSTDPAHSLADVFDDRPVSSGDEAHRVSGGPENLFVRELDAVRALADRRAQLESALDEIASAAGAVGSSSRELLALAPPGIDELFGMLSVIDARADYAAILVDTAPTGHALRLLEMPDAARDWLHVLLRVLLKYRSLVRPGQLGAELVALSKSVRALRDLIRDPARTAFIVVTRAADLPGRETDRLLTRLRRLRLATPAVVVNALTMTPGRCARCRAIATAESRELGALRHRLRRVGRRQRPCAIIQAPLSALPPRGVVALDRFAAAWT